MHSAKNFFLSSFKKTFCLRPLVPLIAVLNQFIATANTHSGIKQPPGGNQHATTKRQRRDIEAYSGIRTD